MSIPNLCLPIPTILRNLLQIDTHRIYMKNTPQSTIHLYPFKPAAFYFQKSTFLTNKEQGNKTSDQY